MVVCKRLEMTTEPRFLELQQRIQQLIARERSRLPWYTRPLSRWGKRALDFAGSLFLLALLAPVLLLTALAVRLTSPGPVLLSQTRLGLGGKAYGMLKFRSMQALNADGSAGFAGEVTASDARLTPIGAFIRAWRLDELPQLLHVFTGTMSFVGPRPDIVENVTLYSEMQLLRFSMPPGCTAWTFTRGGFRNDWTTRQDINVDYVQQWSLWLDVKIVFGSALVLLRQDEANPSTAATAQGSVKAAQERSK